MNIMELINLYCEDYSLDELQTLSLLLNTYIF